MRLSYRGGRSKVANALDEALAFFAAWGFSKAEMLEAMRLRFTPDTVWENIGLSRTVGFEQALAFVQAFDRRLPFARAEVIVHHAAEAGNVVLTERTDHFYNDLGMRVHSVRLMGTLEMDGYRLLAWRDYFNPLEQAKNLSP